MTKLVDEAMEDLRLAETAVVHWAMRVDQLELEIKIARRKLSFVREQRDLAEEALEEAKRESEEEVPS